MLVIRLARGGRKKYPVYRIVAADKRRAATGKFIEVLGNYNPHTKELVIKKEELNEFIANGAQPSDAVLRLMQKDGIDLPKWAEITTKNRKPKKEPEVKEEKVEEAPEAHADAEVASDAAEVKEDTAAEAHNVDTAETEASAEATEGKATEATADAAVETAQEEAKEETVSEDKPAE